MVSLTEWLSTPTACYIQLGLEDSTAALAWIPELRSTGIRWCTVRSSAPDNLERGINGPIEHTKGANYERNAGVPGS